MSFAPGTRFGVYEIAAQIGAGAMGQVFRATDTKLKRRVAIKILPPAVSADPERLARFQREAEVLAALNHPNIAGIYGLEERDGVAALVMELVDGPTLEDLIDKARPAGLPIDEVLLIAQQIAEALEAAHHAGIVHRDLKPANIKVRPDDTVKVLDFGLAKALDAKSSSATADVTNSPTRLRPGYGDPGDSPAMTQAGMILGTAAYMAPEQAKGKAVDRRADVWAFGAVLYEMVVGTRAFAGDSVTDVLASVLAREPDWSKLPAGAPAINGVIRRCLERDPRQRFGDMQSVRLTLSGALIAGPAAPTVVTDATPARTTQVRARSTMLAWGIALVAAIAAIASGLRSVSRPSVETPLVKSSILAPPGVAFDVEVTVGPAVISPNGLLIAFSGRDATGRIQIWVRPIDAMDARPLAGTDGASFPFWSPDSQALGFYSAARGRLERIDLAGGAPVAIASAQFVRGACWTTDGHVLYNSAEGNGQILDASISGGAPKVVIGGSGAIRSPSMLPDGRHVLYKKRNEIHVVSRDGSGDKVLTSATSNAIYANGHLLFMREKTLLAQPLDLASLALTGSATAIARDVQTLVGEDRGVFSASDTGTLVYLDGGSAASTLAWFDGNGRRVGTVGEVGAARGVRLSPDGRTAAIALEDLEGQQSIWTVDLATNTRRQITFAQDSSSSFMTWSPDGRTLAYAAKRNAALLIAQRPAGGGPEHILFTLPPEQSRLDFPRVSAWTNDGSSILYSGTTLGGSWSLPLAPDASGARTAHVLVKEEKAQNIRLAPSGRWFAYQDVVDSGTIGQILVDAFPNVGRRQLVSPRGSLALWGPDGQSLFYADDNMLTVLSVTEADGALHFGAPRAIMPIIVGRGFSYDVAKDGRILAIVTNDAQAMRPLTLIQNWLKTSASR